METEAILLVEDNEKILSANRRMLELNGYAVKTAASLDEARRAVSEGAPALIVLDIMMPDGSGLDFCGEMRESGLDAPVLFLTVLDENNEIVAGLRAGGDDYVTKPYDYEVLLARIEALLRRTRQSGRDASEQQVGHLSFNHTAQRVYCGGKDMLLKPREYALLKFLAQNLGVFFSPETLYKRVWAANPNGDYRTLYAHMSHLRKKLGLEDGALVLDQKRGRGYRLVLRKAL